MRLVGRIRKEENQTCIHSLNIDWFTGGGIKKSKGFIYLLGRRKTF